MQAQGDCRLEVGTPKRNLYFGVGHVKDNDGRPRPSVRSRAHFIQADFIRRASPYRDSRSSKCIVSALIAAGAACLGFTLTQRISAEANSAQTSTSEAVLREGRAAGALDLSTLNRESA